MHAAGRALPVRSPRGDNLWLHRALAVAQPGDLLVVDAGDGAEYGYWGEIMASAAIARGVVGLVITGGVRDSLRLIALNHATFATGTAIRGTIKDPAGDGAVGDPVRLGEVVVRRGDLIVGDADGVLCLPSPDAATVVAKAEARDADEQVILRRLADGETTLAIYRLDPGPEGADEFPAQIAGHQQQGGA
jgi:4-hydroxy-4-methyl-2-oxoglutarate aldolase